MMTVSLVYELQFIVSTRGLDNLTANLSTQKLDGIISVKVSKDYVEIKFRDELIWGERIATASSNFGVESCVAICEIIDDIIAGREWKSKRKYLFP